MSLNDPGLNQWTQWVNQLKRYHVMVDQLGTNLGNHVEN